MNNRIKKISAIFFAIIIIFSIPAPAMACDTEYQLEFQYDSLFVGLGKPSNCDLTDSEWRDYYTEGMMNVYENIYISSRSYDWYRTQKNTNDSDHNCGPACLSMAMKWYDENLDVSVNDIRDEFGVNGTLPLSIVENYLSGRNVPYSIATPSKDNILSTLKQGGIIIAVIKEFIGYHAIIINGCYEYNQELYITYYNPDGNSQMYCLSDIDINAYMQNHNYCIEKWDEFGSALYDLWSLTILPPDSSLK